MMEKDFKVKLIGITENPQLLSTAGALGCFEEKSSAQLAEKLSSLSEGQRDKKEKGVLKNSFGSGHGSVGDQNCFVFSLENVPRAVTLHICQPQYLAHLQQSLRRAKASRGFHLPKDVSDSSCGAQAKKVLQESFELYEKMSEEGVPGEDARYILPLYARTHIQTLGNSRELCHLWHMTRSQETPSVVKKVVEAMIEAAAKKAPYLFEEFLSNYETLAWYPSAQIYSSSNKGISALYKGASPRFIKVLKIKGVSLLNSNSLDFPEGMIEEAVKERKEEELANLKHVHFEFLSLMSLACFHQAIRQRTWDQSVESIYEAVSSNPAGRMTVPESVKNSQFSQAFREQHVQMLNLYHDLQEAGVSRAEAVGVLPHSLKILDLIHINGWNALHSVGKRTCTEAQTEIRNIAREISRHVKEKYPALGKWSEPQCVIYGYCPERRDCGYYKKFKGGS